MIAGLAGGYNDIPAAYRDMRDKGYLDYLFAILLTAYAFFISNWAVMTACLMIIAFAFYILILEPHRYARKREEDFLKNRDDQ